MLSNFFAISSTDFGVSVMTINSIFLISTSILIGFPLVFILRQSQGKNALSDS